MGFPPPLPGPVGWPGRGQCPVPHSTGRGDAALRNPMCSHTCSAHWVPQAGLAQLPHDSGSLALRGEAFLCHVPCLHPGPEQKAWVVEEPAHHRQHSTHMHGSSAVGLWALGERGFQGKTWKGPGGALNPTSPIYTQAHLSCLCATLTQMLASVFNELNASPGSFSLETKEAAVQVSLFCQGVEQGP